MSQELKEALEIKQNGSSHLFMIDGDFSSERLRPDSVDSRLTRGGSKAAARIPFLPLLSNISSATRP
jgi:hypothetical protein